MPNDSVVPSLKFPKFINLTYHEKGSQDVGPIVFVSLPCPIAKGLRGNMKTKKFYINPIPSFSNLLYASSSML